MMTLFREPKSVRRQHLLLSDVNECITCRLCNGYLIDPTTINECMHTYCKSCIAKHLRSHETCPSCTTPNKQVHIDQLRPDHRLKALVYKLVPGLCQSEHQRQRAFNERHDIKPIFAASHPLRTKSASHPDDDDLAERDNNNHTNDDEPMKVARRVNADSAEPVDGEYAFLSADDPISLSLEYHPKAVPSEDADRIPATKYLLCPAALTVYHLQRFLANKYSLSIETTIGGRIDIQIISDDEVLPKSFTLMDIAYCSKWSQINPLRLYYQIFVDSPGSPTQTSQSTVATQFPDAIARSVVHTSVLNKTITSQTKSSASAVKQTTTNETSKHNKYKSQTKAIHYHHNHQTSSTSQHKHDNNAKHLNNNYDFEDDDDDDDTAMHFNQYSISTDKPTKPTKVTLVKNHQATNRSTAATFPTEAKTFKPTKSTSLQNSTNKLDAVKTTSDFKSLRSNDIKYKSDDCVPKSPPKDRCDVATKVPRRSPPKAHAVGRRKSVTSVVDAKTTTSSVNDIFASMKRQHDEEVQKKKTIKPSTANHKQTPTKKSTAITQPPKKAPSIVVCIPPQRRRNSMSDEHYECFSLNKLKTANKKLKTGELKQSISVDKSVISKCVAEPKVEKRNIPKLKIELKRLTKMTKSSIKTEEEVHSPPFEMISFPRNITEYAKHIGLKPVDATSSLETPPVSTDDTESTSQESRTDEIVDKNVHKKRKKSNKHSKEPGSKKRKLHAEISSQHEESLKFKLKLTAPNKSSKSERKVSFSGSSDDSTACPKQLPAITQSVSKTVEENVVQVVPKPSSSIVNYSEFMGPPKIQKPVLINTNPSYSSLTAKRPIPARRKSVAFARPQPPTIQRPRTPDIILTKAFKPASDVSVLNPSVSMLPNSSKHPLDSVYSSNKSCTLKRSMSVDQRSQTTKIKKTNQSVAPKPKQNVVNLNRNNATIDNSRTDTIPDIYIHKINPNKNVDSTKLIDQPSPRFSRPSVEIFQIPTCTTVTQPQSTNALSSNIVIFPALASICPPKIKTLHVNLENSNGLSRDGALDLSGSKPVVGKELPLRGRPPALRSPIAFIDITTPTKADVESNSQSKSTTQIELAKTDASAKSSLEITKIKQNHSNDTSLHPKTDTFSSHAQSSAGLNLLYSALTHTIAPNPVTWLTPKIQNDTANDLLKRKVNELLLNEQRLQNLKLLSESALNREKILMHNTSMFTTINKPRPASMAKHNDIFAVSRSSAVRPQNASIRNIPNPSALAFRQHGHTPTSFQPQLLTSSSVKATTTKDSGNHIPTSTKAATTSSSSLSSLKLLQALTVASPKSTSLPHDFRTQNNNTHPLNNSVNNNNHTSDKSEASLLSKQQQLSASPDTNGTKLIVANPNLHIETTTKAPDIVNSSKVVVSSTAATSSSSSGNAATSSGTTSRVTVVG